MKLNSTSFFNNQFIPQKYCSPETTIGQNISPQLNWINFPTTTKSFLLTFKSLHPKDSNQLHWILADIPTNITKIPEGASNSSKMPEGINELENSFGKRGYTGPQAPKGRGEHFYEATIYALDVRNTGLSGEINEKKLLNKIKGNILSQANLSGKVNIQ